MRLKTTWPYFAGALLLFITIWWLVSDPKVVHMVKHLSIFRMSVSLFISAVIYIISGWQISFLVRRATGKRMDKSDMLVLPASMNLWSYLLPVRGGMIYSMFFIRMKYNVRLVQGFSMGLFTFLMSTCVAGAFGIYYVVKTEKYVSTMSLLSFLLFISPLLLWLSQPALKWLSGRIRMAFIDRLIHLIHEAIGSFSSFVRNPGILLLILLSIFLSIAVYILWVFWAIYSLDLELNYVTAIILAFVLRLSVIARILPGNIGIQELISGLAMGGMGGNLTEGVLIALFIRITALVLAVVFGTYDFFANFRRFKTISFTDLWLTFRS